MSYKKFISINVIRDIIWDKLKVLENEPYNQEISFENITTDTNEICKYIGNNLIFKKLNSGGFGSVYDILFDEMDEQNYQELKSISISINPNGGFEPSYLKSVIKINYQELKLDTRVEYYKKNAHLIINEPFSELFFTSFVNHIYEIGSCLFVVKSHGFFTCDKNLLTLSEKCDEDFFQLLNTTEPKINPKQLKNLIFQFIYGIHSLKKNLGLCHFDTHLNNILFKNLTETYIYKGVDISKKQYFVFETTEPNSFIIMKNIKILCKINDFGQCALFLKKSSYLKKNIVIMNDYDNMGLCKGKEALQNCYLNESYYNTLEIVYFLINLWEYLNKSFAIVYSLNDENLEKSKIFFKDFIIEIYNFISSFFENKFDINEFIKLKKCELKEYFGKLKPLVSCRDVGIKILFEKTDDLIKGLTRSCEKKIKINDNFFYFFEDDIDFSNFSYENSVFFSSSPTFFEQKYNNFFNYTQHDNKMYSEIFLQKKPFVTHIDEEILLKLKNIYTQKLNIFRSGESKNRDIYNLYMFNNELIQQNINREGSFYKQKYQSWFNNKSITNEEVGKIIKILFFHVFKVTSFHNILLSNINLWDSHKFTKSTLSINGGCFIVNGNINNLTRHLISREHLGKPLGYFYSKHNSVNGTWLNYPSVYKNDMGVIYCVNDNIILDSFSTFKKKHTTVPYEEFYINHKTNTKFSHAYSSIAMKTEAETQYHRIGKHPVFLDTNFKGYEWAIECGPILIYNEKVIFNQKKINEIASIDNNAVRTLENSKTPYKFFCVDDENNFYYNMRHSNKFMIHNVIFETTSGDIGFLLVEGRGFDSPGIDRVQLTQFLNFFNIKNAISLDGGFSANAIYKEEGSVSANAKYVMNNNEKRILPNVLNFTYEKMEID